MVLEANVRDLKIKNRRFRNDGQTIGILKRTNGEAIPVSVKRSTLMTYLGRYGVKAGLTIALNGEEIKTSIEHLDRDVVEHYVHNIELHEI